MPHPKPKAYLRRCWSGSLHDVLHESSVASKTENINQFTTDGGLIGLEEALTTSTKKEQTTTIGSTFSNYLIMRDDV